MSEESYEVVFNDGGPYGFRLQGGKEFGRALAVQSITPGGKAASKGICAGDSLTTINDQTTEGMTHLEAQNAIKRSTILKLGLKRKPGNIAVSMGKKDPVVKIETTHSAKVDYKYNSKPKPFGAAKPTPAPVKSPTPKPAPPPEKKEDNLEDSEVLKMLRNSNLTDDSTGLRRMSGGARRTSRGSENNDEDLPPPPPELFEDDEEDPGPQSRTFKLLEKSINSGEDHPSALSRPPVNAPSTTRVTAPKPYSPPSHSRPPQTITIQSGAPPAPAYNRPANSYGGGPAHVPASAPRPPQPAPAAPRASAPPQKKAGTPSCEHCGEVIQGPFVSALGRNWHPDHFCCGGCQCSLQNIGFVEEGGVMYCENCYNQRYAPKCASCNQPIIGVSVKALGKVYHQEHFTCTHCGKQLAGEGFHVENGAPYCSQDYKELFCVKCFSCKQIIRAGDRWMEAMNQKWHADCFRCMNCGIVLEKTGFYTAGNRVFCPDHAQ